jgi:hypothetical protein
MFTEIQNGTLFEIPDNSFGYFYKCWVPPFGYGQHARTGKIKETDVYKRSDIESEQFWEREILPKEYLSRRKHEKEARKINKEHVDPYCEDIRRKNWHRRLYGVWFFNNGVPIYITGLHWLYITYWKFQGKDMDFRIPDRDLFYVVQYCMKDPLCLGLNELTKRKNGKTARVGCWGYERVSRLRNHHAGLQSKSDDDAEKAFKKAIIHPWKKLPDFFRPRYDLMKGEEPNELRLFATARRGEKINEEDNENEEPLESFFDYAASIESAYDGPELHTYVSDEAGKTKRPVSIKERQNVVRYCTEIDGIIQGKHWYTTTVEPDKGEPENYEFQELTADSNPLERDDNGMTTSGLYTYFLPAYKGMYFDKYGYPDEEKAKTFLNNKIKDYVQKNDLRGLSSFKRKNPQSFKEAFSTDGEFALYNPELLNNQLDTISWTNKFVVRGNLCWKDGYRISKPVADAHGNIEYVPSEIYWEDNPNGKFEKLSTWMPQNPNQVYKGALSYFPNNKNEYAIGCDPFRYDKTKDKRRSNCSAFAYRVKDPFYSNEWDDHFVLKYSFREESTLAANEDILKMAWWLGTEVLFERNVNHWKRDFNEWQCAGFLAWMPDEVEPGIITATGQGAGVQVICNYTEAYINQHISKVYFKSLIRKETGWLGFKVEDTEDFDEPMGAGITLIKAKGISQKFKPTEGHSLEDFFPKHRKN